ncbi:MAG TPA: hypothetical protein VLI90_04160, partial [Tepidisphaeraceae bacterium]|nr:hypothetical protein [Tepidisphaeraceae bacterium]
MADTTPNPAPDPNQSIAQPPPRKKRRLWLKIPLALLILLLLFVLLLPTILSTGMARRFALGQANKNLNGHVEVADWSIGWTGGINAQGIKVFDDAGKQVVQLDHFSTELPLTSAMFGKLHLGKVKIDGLSFDLKADEQGKLNVAKVAKPSNPNEPAPPPAKPSSGKLPDISADVQISNVHGTFTQPGKPAVAVTKLDGNIKIPDINQPITNDFNVGLKVGNGPEGSIKTSGTADVIKDNKVALDTANVQQTVTVNNVDLAAAKPFLAGTGIEDVAGQLGANLALDVKGGKDATLDANVNAGNITAAGPALKGDTFTTKTFTVAVPKLSAAFPQGLDHWQSGRIKAGADAGSAPIAVKLDQAQVTATLDVTPQALLNLK